MDSLIPIEARVEYTGEGIMLSKHRLGTIGTVEASYLRHSRELGGKVQVVKVRWDNDGKCQSVFAANVDMLRLNPKWEV